MVRMKEINKKIKEYIVYHEPSVYWNRKTRIGIIKLLGEKSESPCLKIILSETKSYHRYNLKKIVKKIIEILKDFDYLVEVRK